MHTEAEALLAEQNFIKQYKPRFNIRLRDDKSYPYIAISLDEDFPRVYFTRERHRRDRAYFGPFSNAKRVRSTLDVLGKVFMFRSCEGPEPGRAQRLARASTTTSSAARPRASATSSQGGLPRGIDGVIALPVRPLPGDRAQARLRDARTRRPSSASRTPPGSATGCGRSARCSSASGSPTRRSARWTRSRSRCTRAEANAQVFQVRDGVLSDRQSFYLDNEAGGGIAEVAEAFILQYYASAMSIPPLLIVQHDVGSARGAGGGAERAARRPVEIRAAERGDKRRILELAERNARLALDQERLRSERRRQQRVEALDGLQQALGLDTIPLRIECFDISTLMGTQHGRVDGRVRGRRAEEVRLPPVQGSRVRGDGERHRRAGRLRGDGGGLSAPAGAVGAQRDVSPHDKELRPQLRGAAQR